MHQAVVCAAQQDKVSHRSLTTIGPMLHMVGIHEALTGTTGKAATVIPAF
jgi:hypothetical protein